jgi:alanyl-tRNA synthetase
MIGNRNLSPFSAIVVVEAFGETYPELVKKQASIIDAVMEEERSFSTMLDRGIRYFEDEIKRSQKDQGGTVVSADKAFFLYDTLGFPIDLTELMAQESGMTVDMAGFFAEMESQKRRSREARFAARGMGRKQLELVAEQTSWLAESCIDITDDSSKYDRDVEVEAVVKAIFTFDGFIKNSDKADEGSVVGLILDRSSFYAEAGGQDADTGTIAFDVGGELLVNDVQIYGGYILHTGIIIGGSISPNSGVKCRVDYHRRRQVEPNHSMTHVLNAALREVLGEGCDQRGSQCNEEKLRFDFSHKSAMSTAQLRATETFVNNAIARALPVTSEMMSLVDAKAIPNVRAMFGEVYPDPVRVVRVGNDLSVEFCGGTHITNTAEADAFVLSVETSVAKGIRRITALTGDAAKKAMAEGERFIFTSFLALLS